MPLFSAVLGWSEIDDQRSKQQMAKTIVYCADGTWDTAVQHTNVYRLSKMLIRDAGQMVFYDDGVGADGNPISKILGGAFGLGLWNKIKQGYSQIANGYDPNDALFLFGFSRGAYTARSLAGMISVCGLPTKNFTSSVVDTAFNAYRETDPNERKKLLDSLAPNAMFNAPITMVGVWDTVGSLGIPSAIGLSDPILYGFLDTGLHPNVKNGYQALAVDERRVEFPPTLWTSQPVPQQTIEQVWFSGCHCDVGGGNNDTVDGGTALADLTLSWMIDKGQKLGLRFDPTVAAQYALRREPKLALDQLNESWNILWGFFKHRTVAAGSHMSNSVPLRVQHDSSYRPPNLTINNGQIAGTYTMANVIAPAP